ncbi:MAG: hypothetical protein J3K34DRAFT_527615 [Monoraphidium minutum]|nr:MAG: hypothetical protein J3K34DRAFT_527615 [Monoraphidium minutum]
MEVPKTATSELGDAPGDAESERMTPAASRGNKRLGGKLAGMLRASIDGALNTGSADQDSGDAKRNPLRQSFSGKMQRLLHLKASGDQQPGSPGFQSPMRTQSFDPMREHAAVDAALRASAPETPPRAGAAAAAAAAEAARAVAGGGGGAAAPGVLGTPGAPATGGKPGKSLWGKLGSGIKPKARKASPATVAALNSLDGPSVELPMPSLASNESGSAAASACGGAGGAAACADDGASRDASAAGDAAGGAGDPGRASPGLGAAAAAAAAPVAFDGGASPGPYLTRGGYYGGYDETLDLREVLNPDFELGGACGTPPVGGRPGGMDGMEDVPDYLLTPGMEGILAGAAGAPDMLPTPPSSGPAPRRGGGGAPAGAPAGMVPVGAPWAGAGADATVALLPAAELARSGYPMDSTTVLFPQQAAAAPQAAAAAEEAAAGVAPEVGGAAAQANEGGAGAPASPTPAAGSPQPRPGSCRAAGRPAAGGVRESLPLFVLQGGGAGGGVAPGGAAAGAGIAGDVEIDDFAPLPSEDPLPHGAAPPAAAADAAARRSGGRLTGGAQRVQAAGGAPPQGGLVGGLETVAEAAVSSPEDAAASPESAVASPAARAASPAAPSASSAAAAASPGVASPAAAAVSSAATEVAAEAAAAEAPASPGPSPLQPRRLSGGRVGSPMGMAVQVASPAPATPEGAPQVAFCAAAAAATPATTPKVAGAAALGARSADAAAAKAAAVEAAVAAARGGASAFGSPASGVEDSPADFRSPGSRAGAGSPTLALYEGVDTLTDLRAMSDTSLLVPSRPAAAGALAGRAPGAATAAAAAAAAGGGLLDRRAASPSAAAAIDVDAARHAPLVDSSPFDLDSMDTMVFREDLDKVCLKLSADSPAPPSKPAAAAPAAPPAAAASGGGMEDVLLAAQLRVMTQKAAGFERQLRQAQVEGEQLKEQLATLEFEKTELGQQDEFEREARLFAEDQVKAAQRELAGLRQQVTSHQDMLAETKCELQLLQERQRDAEGAWAHEREGLRAMAQQAASERDAALDRLNFQDMKLTALGGANSELQAALAAEQARCEAAARQLEAKDQDLARAAQELEEARAHTEKAVCSAQVMAEQAAAKSDADGARLGEALAAAAAAAQVQHYSLLKQKYTQKSSALKEALAKVAAKEAENGELMAMCDQLLQQQEAARVRDAAGAAGQK